MDTSLRSTQIERHGPLLLVHGGAWDIPDAVLEDHRAGLREALDAGQGPLRNGAAELDAGLMAGRTLDYGAVMATRRLAHPVRAHRLLTDGEGRVRMLASSTDR